MLQVPVLFCNNVRDASFLEQEGLPEQESGVAKFSQMEFVRSGSYWPNEDAVHF